MEHRNWNKNNIRTSLLGYGCMRFPTKADGTIDEERAEALLNTAKAAGVNYFDTAYPYHNGQSEPFVGRVIAKWDRSSFYLATKMPLWKCKSLDDAKRIFEEQLQRLGVDYIDFYLLHSLHKARYEKAKARVANVREDGKLNLSLQKPIREQINNDSEMVYNIIESYGGTLPFNDKADKEVIEKEFGLSKNAFKRAVGHLLKEGKIRITEKNIIIK
jgi:hypothetical protein